MPIRVLVVDDFAAMRTFVSSALESAGEFEVEEVGHGFEAIRSLRRSEYELLIADINMPDFNGIELIRAVRELPRYAATPIVVMSTEGRLGDLERARAAGASAVLTKPFTREGLLAAVAAARQAVASGGGA